MGSLGWFEVLYEGRSSVWLQAYAAAAPKRGLLPPFLALLQFSRTLHHSYHNSHKKTLHRIHKRLRTHASSQIMMRP